jgi:hypothetical protein
MLKDIGVVGLVEVDGKDNAEYHHNYQHDDGGYFGGMPKGARVAD